MVCNEGDYWREKVQQAQVDRETSEVNMFMVLKGAILQDGDMYEALIGADLMLGCVAYEKTRLQAILSCMKNFRFEKTAKVVK
jgi:hypothetical protein